jgi:hypothetical protein
LARWKRFVALVLDPVVKTKILLLLLYPLIRNRRLPPNFRILEIHPGLEARLLLFLGVSIHKGNDSFSKEVWEKWRRRGRAYSAARAGETGSEMKAPAQSIAVRGRPGLMGRTIKKITGDLNEGRGE